MEKRLVKNLDRMYLVFETEYIDENEYIIQMALQGNLPSLLPLSISTIDGKKILRADVTGCTDIASRYRAVQMTGGDIRKILMAVYDVIRKLPGYLLDPGDLCLEPEYVFLGPDGDEILLTYIPHFSESGTDTLPVLAEFFLKKLDHCDSAAAGLAYGLFDRVQSENYIAADVLAKLLQGAKESIQSQSPGQVFEQGTQRAPGRDQGKEQPRGPRRTPGRAPQRESQRDSGRAPQRDSQRTRGQQQEPGSKKHLEKTTSARRRHPSSKGRKGRPPAYTRGTRSTRGTRGARSTRGTTSAGKRGLKRFLPAGIILSAGTAAILVFHMDLTQIGGMGFLSAALIWLTYSSVEKRRSEIHNVWADEDDPGDDAFYQSLLKQVYAEDFREAEPPDDRPGPAEVPLRSGPCLISLQPDLSPDIPLSSSHMLLGKSRQKADVILPDDTVSRVHARIEHKTDGFYVSDLYSTNGTWLGEQRLESGIAVRLKEDEVLQMGELRYRVYTGSAMNAQ